MFLRLFSFGLAFAQVDWNICSFVFLFFVALFLFFPTRLIGVQLLFGGRGEWLGPARICLMEVCVSGRDQRGFFVPFKVVCTWVSNE